MKKILMIIFGISVVLTTYAELPKWVIFPTNDKLFVKIDDNVIEGQAGGKTSLWTMDGRLLYTTDNTIMPYKDGVATVIQKNDILGFVDPTGKFTSLRNASVAYGYPYFEDGFLLCIDKEKQTFFNKDGVKAAFPEVTKAYPFHNGFAPYFTYEQPEKKKDPHYGLFKADGQEMKYMLTDNENVKSFDPKDLEFVSAIGTNGKAIAVIKNKVYWFDPATEVFEPFLWGDDKSAKKRHLNLNGNYEGYFQNLDSDTIGFAAKYGKNQIAELRFDRLLRPLSVTFEDNELKFIEKPASEFVYNTNLTQYGYKDKYGLSFDGKEILPQQFEEIGLRYGNKAFVRKNGKWGVIEIIPDLECVVKLNKGEVIPFRHQKFETQIRLDLPPYVSAKDARIDIPEETGLRIDKTSRESKDTESGNFVTYNCVLNIPTSLPDTITTITYEPVNISYDGIKLFGKPLPVKAWHYKYYNVDPIESETSISNGVLSFTVNINAQRNVGESDYPFEVRIEADDILVEQEKLSETRRKFHVSNLQEGTNNLNISVIEAGCPASVFPFEIYYTKPVPKKKKKEEVVIRKKDTVVKKTTPRLEL